MSSTKQDCAAARQSLRHGYEARTDGALDAKAAGKLVVGYLGHSVPVELIEAAGCFAVGLDGNPLHDTPLADQLMDLDSDGDTRSLFQSIAAGELNFCDLIVIPRSSNALLSLYYLLLEARRLLPDAHFPEIYLFDILNTPYWSTGQYVHGRMLALRERLAQLAGRAIPMAAIRDAIVRRNAGRRALQALNDLRRAVPPLCPGADLLRAVGAARGMEPALHLDLVNRLHDLHEPLAGLRLMVKGMPHDRDDFYRLVEDMGHVIVADDHFSGERIIGVLVDEDADPVEALTHFYQVGLPTVRSYPQSVQDQHFVGIVAAAAVQGVIFMHDEYDDVLGWDYPAQKGMLDKRGIPSVLLARQSYRHPDRDAQRTCVDRLAHVVIDQLNRSRP